jgi:queuosine precursor transporter
MKQKNSLIKISKRYKYLDIIFCLAVAFQIFSTTTAAKITYFGLFTASVTVLYFPFTFLIGDILTEVYGYKQGRRAMWILIFVQILTASIYEIVTFLPAVHGFKGNEAYIQVLGQAPRNVLGGIIGVFGGQFVNDFTLAKMKIITKGKFLWTRTIGSTIAGQFVNTVLFYVIALSNVIPTGLLLQTILSGWILKVIVETVMTPFTYYIVKKLKKEEHEDYYDRNTNFNPLILD